MDVQLTHTTTQMCVYAMIATMTTVARIVEQCCRVLCAILNVKHVMEDQTLIVSHAKSHINQLMQEQVCVLVQVDLHQTLHTVCVLQEVL